MSARKSLPEMWTEAGFLPGEVEASRNLRAAVCNGTASAEDQLAYGPFSAKWDKFAALVGERDQADALERQAPSPARHSGDPDGGLGAAMRQHRNNQPPPKIVVRTRLIQVDDGTGSLMDIPEAQPLPLYRGSADATGYQRIAAGLSSADKKR